MDLALFPSSRSGQDVDAEALAAYLRARGWSVGLGPSPPAEASRVWYHHVRIPGDRQSFLERTAGLPSLGAPLQLAGGFLASRRDEELLEELPALDGVVRGDPEAPLDALLHRGCSRPVPRVDGITRRDARGRPQRGSGVQPPARLDLPTAAADRFGPDRLKAGQKIILSRGCFDDCSYCGFQHGQGVGVRERWRTRPAKDVVEEIEAYRRRGVRRFAFQANVFFGYDERGTETVADICREILARRLDVGFRFVTHPHHLLRNRDLLPLLIGAGLEHVHLGIDSGSPAALARYRVPFTSDDAVEALGLLHDHRVGLTPGFIFYDPLAAWPEVRQQLDFLRRIAGFFDHRPQTYPRILETELLSRNLQAFDHTPLTDTLRRRGVVVEDGTEPLTLRFADPRVASFHRLHRRVAGELLRPLRPLTWSPAGVAARPDLALLPLDLLDRLAGYVDAGRTDADDVLRELTADVGERLAPGFETLREVVTWPRGMPRGPGELLPAPA